MTSMEISTKQLNLKMESKLSKPLADIVDALPLKNGIRVLEIGCGPGAIGKRNFRFTV